MGAASFRAFNLGLANNSVVGGMGGLMIGAVVALGPVADAGLAAVLMTLLLSAGNGAFCVLLLGFMRMLIRRR